MCDFLKFRLPLGVFLLMVLTSCHYHQFLSRRYTQGCFLSHRVLPKAPSVGREAITVHSEATPHTTQALVTASELKQKSVADLYAHTRQKDADTVYLINGKRHIGRVMQVTQFSLVLEEKNTKAKKNINLSELNYIVYDNQLVEYSADLRAKNKNSWGGFRTLFQPGGSIDWLRVIGFFGGLWLVIAAIIAVINSASLGSGGLVLLLLLILLSLILGVKLF